MITRIFDTAISPEDVEAAKEIFRTKVRPAFRAFEGCEDIQMHIGVEEHSQDLIDLAAISRWSSLDQIEAATSSDDYERALADLTALFRQSPIVRHFETVD